MVNECWIGKDEEGNGHGMFEDINPHSSGGQEENTKRLRIIAVLAEIRTAYHPNTSQKCYRTNQLARYRYIRPEWK
jgi:hypothetical protein